MIKSLILLIKKIFESLFGHLVCLHCKQNQTKKIFCHPCVSKTPFPVPWFQRGLKLFVYSLGRYDGFLRFVVNQKYRKNVLAYYALEERIIELFHTYKLDDLFDIVIPVPKASLSRISQGFNPAEVIAMMIKEKFAKDIFLAVYTKKCKQRQVGLENQERKKNIKDVFYILPSDGMILQHKRILIIDDVYTTGATIAALVDALKEISFHSITVFVLAR